MQRRQFLRLGMAGSALGLMTLGGCSRSRRQQPILFSASDRDDVHTLSGWQPDFGERFRVTVPQRAHAPLLRPFTSEVVFVARRPGTALYIVDTRAGAISRQVEAAPDRHFYGHAAFSNDGRWLFVPENAFDGQGAGKLGVYDASANYQKVDEFDLQGIGPHQLVLMPDAFTLAIALGGIQTHPLQSRDKLNLDSMHSELVFLDSRNGQVTQRFAAPHRHLSLRHLDVAGDGTVVVGAQFQTEAAPDVDYAGPLVFSQRGAESLEALQGDLPIWQAQRHYIASVAMNSAGTQVLTTSPRGGVVNLWSVADGALIRQYPVRDVAGAGFLPEQNRFIVSNGLGQLFGVADDLQLLASVADTRWDNHLIVHG